MIYNDILERTGASSATISRVNRSLSFGAGGYQTIFDRMNEQQNGAEMSDEQAKYMEALIEKIWEEQA